MAKKNKNIKRGKDHHFSKPDDQKVAKVVYVPTGKPRGRPKGYKNVGGTPKAKVASGKPRGRPAKEWMRQRSLEDILFLIGMPTPSNHIFVQNLICN